MSSRLMWVRVRMDRECWAFVSANGLGWAVREVRKREMNFGMS